MNPLDERPTEIPYLALTPRQAARSLSISERMLWGLTERGAVPCIRIGRRVVYPIDLLRDWLRNQPPAYQKPTGT